MLIILAELFSFFRCQVFFPLKKQHFQGIAHDVGKGNLQVSIFNCYVESLWMINFLNTAW